MVNIGPQRENINNTIDIVNITFKTSKLENHPVFQTLERRDTIDEELKETKKLQQKARECRKEDLYETDIPLKTGPMRILRFQLRVLEEELAEYQMRLREQKSIQGT